MKVLTNKLNSIPELRETALFIDENGVALKHTGDAKMY